MVSNICINVRLQILICNSRICFILIALLLLHNLITKTCPCNIQRCFSAVRIEHFIEKLMMILTILLKTLIVGTN